MQPLKDFGVVEKGMKVSAILTYHFAVKILFLSVMLNFITLFFVNQPFETSGNNVAWLTLFNVRPVNAQTLKQTLEQIDLEAQKAEAQIDKQLLKAEAALKNRELMTALLAQQIQVKILFRLILDDDEKYKRALESPNIAQNIKDLLRRAKNNFGEIDKYVEEQSNPKILAEKRKLEVRRRRDLARKEVINRALRLRLR